MIVKILINMISYKRMIRYIKWYKNITTQTSELCYQFKVLKFTYNIFLPCSHWCSDYVLGESFCIWGYIIGVTHADKSYPMTLVNKFCECQ